MGLTTVLFLVDRSPDGGVPSEVVSCGFGPVRISAKPLDRFQGGFRILIRVDNEPGNPTILVPPSRFVFVVDGGGVVLGQDGTFTWATVFPVEVPAGGSYEGSVAVAGDGLPVTGDRVAVRVEEVSGGGPDCTLAVDGVPVP